MFEQLNMLMRVACLYVRRQKRLDLLKQIKASDLSDEDRERIIDIMQRMRIIAYRKFKRDFIILSLPRADRLYHSSPGRG